MKKLILSGVAGAALFAGGFWSGRVTSPSGSADASGDGPVASALAKREAAEKAAAGKLSGAAGGAQVRAFAAGRPFVKGQAKAWLLEVAGTLQNARENPVAVVDAIQAFLTMDEESVVEVSAALSEYMALHKAGDPAVKAAVKDEDLIEGGLMISLVRLSQFNPEAALDLIKANSGEIDRDAVTFVISRIAAQDPVRAEQAALTLADRERHKALESIMHTMAAKDPAAALAFAGRHAKEISTDEQRQVLENWVRRDPLQALPAAVQAMEKSGNPDLLRQPLEAWNEMDPKAATAWAASHDGPGKVTAQAFMLESRARENPEAVLPEFAALQKSAANPAELKELATSLADSYAQKNFPGASQWVMTLPAGEVQDNAINTVAQKWVREDSAAASKWIETLPQGMARDNAAVDLAREIVRREPAAAFEWACSIQDAEKRGDAMSRTFGSWQAQDPDGARAAAASLPEAERKKLQQGE